MMRNLSVGAMLYVLLIVVMLLWGPLSRAAVAQSGVTIGFALDGSGLVDSSEQGEELGRYLESQLSMPVKVRSFAAEHQLYSWLTRYNEVDFAWFSKDFLDEVSAGQLYLLAKNVDHSSGHMRGEVVARQGLNDALRQQMQVAFLKMHENTSGLGLLSKLGTSRFISPMVWQTPEWAGASASPLATGRSVPAEEGGWETPEWTTDPELKSSSDVVVAPEQGRAASVVVTEPSVAVAQKDVSGEVVAPQAQSVVLTDVPVTVPSPVAMKAEVPSQDEPDDVKEALPAPLVVNESNKASTQKTPPVVEQEPQIALVADYLAYNSEDDSYEARGDVVLRQAGVELKSEELLWQSATQDAAAQGAVQLKDADTEVTGSSLQYNMATGQGQVHDGRVVVREGNFHLAGDQIEKQGQADYFVRNGSFTTCDGDVPDWKFTAREIDVTLGGYAKAKGVWFHIKDVPVLYTPYLLYPVKTERESGLLTPYFGYSNNKGTRASLAWYQVIDRNMDATVYLDYLSEIGLGKGLEYRYALANKNAGKALYYHVTGLGDLEDQDEKEDFPDLDYYNWEHSGELPGDWRLNIDIEYTDDKLFFEEFGEAAEEYNRDKTVSTLMLRRNWQKLNLVGFARYIQDLETNNDETLQRLPEVGLGLTRYRLGDTPFYASLESYATRFDRDEGEDGERLYLKPALSAAFKPLSWLEIVPQIALTERLYDADSKDDEQFSPEFSLALSTRLLKGYDLNQWGVDRVQHSIEPKVTYTYVPDEPQDDLPLFDLLDRVLRQNAVSYSLVNRLTTSSTAEDGSKSYREVLNLRLSQSYDVDEARNDRTGDDQPFSDVRAELDVRPTRNLSFDAESLIPVYGDNGFRTLSVGSSIRDDSGNALKVNYIYKDEDFANVATDYVRLQLDTSILKPVYLRFEERYDFQDSQELEKIVGLEYRSKCWSLLLTYRNRYVEDGDDDHEIGLAFVLAGLGQNTGFGNGFGAVHK